ncbi:hypothetical protein AVDCRST_MAG84-4325 [uncultured Microcoleus sp.]|uniref:Uncharacterized protein n=1 Tax=uncultured Microcoleus sp. TaxID=259945 RepID=A0A6J4MWR8_9CYAN|nr:hypothetical protein AVDCRST_MAG84-4325 [uncultured Microcoleus sp.]
MLIVRSAKVVNKCLKRWKSLLRAIDKSSLFYRQLIIKNISRIMLNGYDANTLTTP